MDDKVQNTLFPPLPIEEWEETKNTVHLYSQIVGKIRLGLFPKKNHWWHVTFYVSPRGFTTGAIPYGSIVFEIEFDCVDHVLNMRTSHGSRRSIPLNGLSVSQFYKGLFSSFSELGIDVTIRAIPYDVPSISTEPFETDHQHASYYSEYVNRFWQILVQVDSIFQEFRGRFIGKSSPVHLFWHHLDLAVARFSGRPAPAREGANSVEREAYSHEVISCGFWAGDEKVREPAFYAYAYPEPEGLAKEPLNPTEAFYNPDAGMALLMYNKVRESQSPKQVLLNFLETFYQAAAKRANWDVKAFQLPRYDP
jgi:hypothetical protein